MSPLTDFTSLYGGLAKHFPRLTLLPFQRTGQDKTSADNFRVWPQDSEKHCRWMGETRRRTVIIPCVKDLQEVIALQDFSGVYQSLITPTFILSFVIILCSVVVALPSEVGCVSEIIYDENK
ncbi:hypothetical protein NC653_012964 [Populus alba x Populus x berolinensis]|uniref:Uncharacterized protein n=1 Tax=Populus alba x Populus x berolinensis TaxID=444605 RepID=A0AAD6QTI2_9ROSI|nr:hypothetical protein NC653_012964 [Populus alba x Populus x berolinensis]